MADVAGTPPAEALEPTPVPEAPVAPEVTPEPEGTLEHVEQDAEQAIRDAIAEAQALISRLQGHLNDHPPVPAGPNG